MLISIIRRKTYLKINLLEEKETHPGEGFWSPFKSLRKEESVIIFSESQNHNTWFDHGGKYRDNRQLVLTVTLKMHGFCKYNAAKPESFLHMGRFDFYFSTLISYQWVFGPSYFVEYLINELPCNKSQASSCALQPPDSVVSIPKCLHNLRSSICFY